jgi:hypothetical protein
MQGISFKGYNIGLAVAPSDSLVHLSTDAILASPFFLLALPSYSVHLPRDIISTSSFSLSASPSRSLHLSRGIILASPLSLQAHASFPGSAIVQHTSLHLSRDAILASPFSLLAPPSCRVHLSRDMISTLLLSQMVPPHAAARFRGFNPSLLIHEPSYFPLHISLCISAPFIASYSPHAPAFTSYLHTLPLSLRHIAAATLFMSVSLGALLLYAIPFQMQVTALRPRLHELLACICIYTSLEFFET